MVSRGPAPSAEDQRRLVSDNAPLLAKLAALTGKPSVVVDLRPGVDTVRAIEYPNVTRLLALAARQTSSTNSAEAIRYLMHGAEFSEAISRDGATVHLTSRYLSYVAVFRAFPEILQKLTPAQAREAAGLLADIMESASPLATYIRNEREVRLNMFKETVTPGTTRGFRLNLPSSDLEWKHLMTPKSPAAAALSSYLEAWESNANKPFSKLTPPAQPAAFFTLQADDTLSSSSIGQHFIRYYYVQARSRLMLTALLLAARKGETGRYPVSLAELRTSQTFDPFSGQPFVYSPTASGYKLYSVGPNGKDDGGKPYHEGKMNPRNAGDLLLTPSFQ